MKERFRKIISILATAAFCVTLALPPAVQTASAEMTRTAGNIPESGRSEESSILAEKVEWSQEAMQNDGHLAIDTRPHFIKSDDASGQIVLMLDEYLAQDREAWFLTGKKEYAVKAMMVSEETAFHNDLEAVDYTVTDDGFTVILKGVFGEMWTSKLPKVISTYTKPDGSEIREDAFADRDSWIDIKTRAEPETYYAMHVPLNTSVTVKTAWEDELHTNLPNAPHGNGDYLVCRKNEKGEPDLSDVWVLNGLIFPEYYDTDGITNEAGNDPA